MHERSIQILLIENKKSDAHQIKAYLSAPDELSYKYNIISSSSIKEALEIIQRENLSLILLDLEVSDNAGMDTIKEILSHSNLPIIIFINTHNQNLAVRTLEIGVQDYLVKGEFSEQELKKSIRFAIQRNKIEKELLELNKNLINSNRDLEQFACIASHDLQEPLRKIMSFSEILKENLESKLDEENKNYLNIIIDGGIRMSQLIKDLLEFSRVQSDSSEFIKTDLNKILQDVLSNLELYIKEKKARINISNNLPTILGNPTLLQEVFQNLISNSLKFGNNENIKIEINCQLEQKKWLISIKDNGIGFDNKFSEKIFNIFNKLHSRNIYPGTGVGLALCQRIIEKHNGKIWAKAEPNKGATFFLTLPKNNK